MESIKLFISTHHEFCAGLAMVSVGLFLVMGAIRRWAWLLELGGNEYRNMGLIQAALYHKFGDRYLQIRMIFIGAMLIICGSLFAWLANK